MRQSPSVVFCRVQLQPVVLDPLLDRRQCRLCLVSTAAQDDEVVCIAHRPVPSGEQQLVQRVQVDVGQQRADHRALRGAARGSPALEFVHDVLVQPAVDQRQHLAVADLLGHPRHQSLVRDGVEEALEVRVHHVCAALAQPALDFAQRVLAAFARSKPVAVGFEAALEDRLDHPLQRRLYHPVFDDRDAQCSLAATGLGNLHPPHRLRSVGAASELLGQLAQVSGSLGVETRDAHAVQAARPAAALDLLPGRCQRGVTTNFVDQTEPFVAFAFLGRRCQRRQHAWCPDFAVYPFPLRAFQRRLDAACTGGIRRSVSSRLRHWRCCLLVARSVFHAFTFLPTFPRPGLCCPGLWPLRSSLGTTRALTPAHRHLRRTGLPACLVHPSWRSTSNHSGRFASRFVHHASACNVFQASPLRCRLATVPQPNRVRHPADRQFALRLLPTPPHSDAVAFGFGALAYPDRDFHPAE